MGTVTFETSANPALNVRDELSVNVCPKAVGTICIVVYTPAMGHTHCTAETESNTWNTISQNGINSVKKQITHKNAKHT